ncbi:MAG: TIGR04219 family outer membrane beta-barrel protein [Gammaproteobacteria bacterium]
MKPRLTAVFPLLLLLCGTAAADTLGVRVGAAYWAYDIEGFARYKSKDPADNIDVQDDLGYNDDSLVFGYLLLEHPIPLLPNVKISKTAIDSKASGNLSASFTYGDLTFTANEAVDSQVELDQVDITLYYQVLDNVVNIDLGLNAKYIDSKAKISGALSGTEEADVSGWVPMVYAGVGVDLPFSGLGVSADGSYIGYSGSKFYDYSVRATYTTPWVVGVDVGYRKLKLDLDDFDNSYANIEFSGPYAGLYASF